jgi:hypothetical protein
MNAKRFFFVLLLLGMLGWIFFDAFYGPADVIQPYMTAQQLQQ